MREMLEANKEKISAPERQDIINMVGESVEEINKAGFNASEALKQNFLGYSFNETVIVRLDLMELVSDDVKRKRAEIMKSSVGSLIQRNCDQRF